MANESTKIGMCDDQVSFLTLEKPMNIGEQGETWLAHATNETKLLYVVKLCRADPEAQPEAVKDFENECKALVELQHPNIVRIVCYGVGLVRVDKTLPYAFYAMDYLGEDTKSLKEALAETRHLPRKVLLALCALKDAATALSQVHARNWSHGDIKESNILVCLPGNQKAEEAGNQKPEIRLIDFGFARFVPGDGTTTDLGRGPQKFSSIRRRRPARTEQHADIFQLCFMISRCLDGCPKPGKIEDQDKQLWPIDPAAYEHLRRLLADWASESENSKPEVAETREFYDELATLTKSYDLAPDVRGAVRYLSIQEIATAAEIRQAFEAIRIPPRKLVLYTERINQLITTQEFGALRFVRQLGFTHLVYPGALGTRFEHSLGMYSLACQFIIRMSGDEAFRKWCESEHNVLKFLVAALLHDVGHFPFAHQLEEFQDNDFKEADRQRVATLIKGHHPRGRQVIADLGPLLLKLFNFTPDDIEDIRWLAVGFEKRDSSREDKPDLAFLRTLLDGAVDLDKLDYIERDAHHCGVPYGSYLDVARIIETMRVIEKSGRPTLAFDKRIAGSLEQFATARHQLYANVYWHRAVRSATVMFKHAFYLFQGLGLGANELKGLFYQAFSDDRLLQRMEQITQGILAASGKDHVKATKAKATLRILHAVSGWRRVLYKAILERENTERLGRRVGQSYGVQRESARNLFQKLKEGGFLVSPADDIKEGSLELGEHNLLIDCHSDDFPHFGEIQIVGALPGEPKALRELAPAVEYLRQNFSAQACKIRVFLNPEVLKPGYRSKAGRAAVREFVEMHLANEESC